MREGLHLPVPYFLIDESYHILSCSRAAEQQLGVAGHLLALIDEDSQAKCRNLIHPHAARTTLELNMRPHGGAIELYNVHQQWSVEDGMPRGHLICMPLDQHLQQITEQMHQLRQNLTFSEPPPPSRQFPPSPADAPAADALKVLRDLSHHIATMRDLLQLLQPALIEIGREGYAQLLRDEIDAVDQLLLEQEETL